MINLLVDEAYAFDYLSILGIKKTINSQNQTMYLECLDNLSKQIDEKIFFQILSSSEYMNLLLTNQEVFDAVEQARYGNISAKEVDEKNMKRHKAKQQLQNKFFSSHPIREFKT